MPALTLGDLFRCTSDGGVVFAHNASGKPVHVDEVPRGKACGCHCPGCGRPVIARQGALLAHSFAHASDSANPACATAGETALHLVAKDYLAEALVLTLPEHEVSKGGLSKTVVKEGEFSFDRAEVERALPGMRPDVVVHKGNRPLLVEFKVTHACGYEKIARIREQELAAIEIDLGPYRDRQLNEIAPAILHEAKRIWLNNPKDRDAELQLDNRLREIEEDNRAEATRRLAAYQVRSSRDRRPAKVTTDYGLTEAVGYAVGGAGCFKVPVDVWQSSILLALCSVGSPHSVEKIVKHLDREGLIRPEFREVPSSVRAFMLEQVVFQDDAVAEFLNRASKGGWATQVGDAWARSAKLVDTVKEAIALQERPIIRREQLSETISELLDLVPQDDRCGFDLNVWWTKGIPSLRKSPSSLLGVDEQEWSRFETLFSSLKYHLVWRPEQIGDTLGLPIAAERDRRIERRVREEEERRKEKERQAAEAAENRVYKIGQKAIAVLSVQAEEWLKVPLAELEGRTPLEAAAYSTGEYENARYILETENDRRRRERFDASTRRAALDRLEMQARRALGDEAGGLWMQSDNRYLGQKSPSTHCVNPETLEECRNALALISTR